MSRSRRIGPVKVIYRRPSRVAPLVLVAEALKIVSQINVDHQLEEHMVRISDIESIIYHSTFDMCCKVVWLFQYEGRWWWLGGSFLPSSKRHHPTTGFTL